MRENTLKAIWKRGEAAVNGWLSIPSAFSAEVMAQGRGPKLKIIKFKRRKHYQKETGHRQAFTTLTIKGIKQG